MWNDIKNILFSIIIFQCLFLTFYLISQKARKRLSNIILACMLICIALAKMNGVFFHFRELNKIILSHAPHLIDATFPFVYLYIPILFFYILSITKKGFRFKKIYLVHFIPFVFFCVYIGIKYGLLRADEIREMINTDTLYTSFETHLFFFTKFVQFFVYAIVSLVIIKKYRMRIKNLYSTVDSINLSWLNFVLFGFIVWKSLEAFEYFLWILTDNEYVFIFYIIAEIVFLVFLALMVFKGLKQPEIFLGVSEPKYEKTLLPEEIKEDYKKKLMDYMESKKPYLDPSLNLKELAEQVSIPPHHLSQILNTHLDQNFFDFINSYRIKESQRLLLEQTSGKKTILEVLYQVGFNSKSVFNNAFKKYTGMTPTQFKKVNNS